jgi:hypothetical protein
MPTRTPKLQQRSQYNPHWGVYANPGALPNASGAPLAAVDFTLEAGDVAYVTSTGGLYFCVTPGTAGGGDAVWRRSNAPGTITLNGSVTGVTPEVLGAYYFDSGQNLPASAIALVGRLTTGIATLRMIRQSDAAIIAWWSAAAPLGSVVPVVALPITPGWYLFDLAGNAADTIALAYGVWLDYE